MSSSQASSQQRGPSPGFIGVGTMGRPMARRLIEAGHKVIVYDRDETALAELEAAGARFAAAIGRWLSFC